MSKKMEIERKFLIDILPELSKYKKSRIEQGYMNKSPAIRVRRIDDEYFFTYKGEGLLSREEYEFHIPPDTYEHLLGKCDGRIIKKDRYYIPYEKYMIELDIFEDELAPLILAEVEFDSLKEAKAFIPPSYFGKDVTKDKAYHNSNMIDGILPWRE